MKTLIYGAGPLGSLYAYLLNKSGNDVTILARNDHFKFLSNNGVKLVNEFTGKKYSAKIDVTDSLSENDQYDLVIVLMRKNRVIEILPILGKTKKIPNILIMGNSASGFDEYLEYIPKEKLIIGFPGGGGSIIEHVAHYIDSEKPNGTRMPVTLGEIDSTTKKRTEKIAHLFESSNIPVKIVDDIESWQKYHVAFINPLAGALLFSGDNYNLAKNKYAIIKYIRAVKEGRKVLRTLGFKKSYNSKLNLITVLPEFITVRILSKVFDSKFAEIAMMMHVNSAKDEMLELASEFQLLCGQAGFETPYINELKSYIK